jgi:hypothetical protein
MYRLTDKPGSCSEPRTPVLNRCPACESCLLARHSGEAIDCVSSLELHHDVDVDQLFVPAHIRVPGAAVITTPSVRQ